METKEVGLPAFNTGDKATHEELTLERLFPLQSGRRWMYKYKETKFSYYYNRIMSEFSTMETWDVEESLSSQSKYILIKHDHLNKPSINYSKKAYIVIGNNSSGLFWTGLKDEYKSSEHLFDGKLLIYPLEVNSSWKTDMPFYGSDFYIKLSGTNKVSTVSDIVETPAGNFPHCVRIDFTVTERLNVTGTGLSDVSGVINYWYTPDIGIVKTRLFIKVESIDDNTINESSEVTRILEGYWRIKK